MPVMLGYDKLSFLKNSNALLPLSQITTPPPPNRANEGQTKKVNEFMKLTWDGAFPKQIATFNLDYFG